MVPTRDHGEILDWAQKHGATPAQILPLKFDGRAAILYFILEGAAPEAKELHPISWDSFFAQFDLLNLSFAYDNHSSQFHIVRVEKSAAKEIGN